jgi:hypothetical protein
MRQVICERARAVSAEANKAQDAALIVATAGGVIGGVLAGPEGALAGAEPGLAVGQLASYVGSGAQLVADFSQARSVRDSAVAVARFGFGVAGGRLLSRGLRPFWIAGPYLDRAQQVLRNMAFGEYGSNLAQKLDGFMNPSHPCR